VLSLIGATLCQRISDDIADLCEVFCLSTSAASAILRAFKWDLTATRAALAEDRGRVFAEVGVMDSEGPEFVLEGGGGGGGGAEGTGMDVDAGFEFECPVCCCDADTALSLKCGHRVCETCWGMYLTGKINAGGSREITCAHHGCRYSNHAEIED
jgi:ariadne-1